MTDVLTDAVIFYRDELVKRLDISLERLTFDILQDGQMVLFNLLIDGKDLTPEQNQIAIEWIKEHDIGLNIIKVIQSVQS